MNVPFSQVAVGSTFTYNGQEYVKTEKKKISCCKFFNATATDNVHLKIGLKGPETVEVKDPE